jgi:serine/threonine protein kinase
VRLLDFGLAQLAEEEPLTATGDVPGTLAYVPPERLVNGESGGPPADVWAVGTMLWGGARGLAPVLERLAARDGEAHRARRARRSPRPRPDLPKALCALVDRMLALDPAARAVGGALAHELRDAFAERLRRRKTRPTIPALGRVAAAGGARGRGALRRLDGRRRCRSTRRSSRRCWRCSPAG